MFIFRFLHASPDELTTTPSTRQDISPAEQEIVSAVQVSSYSTMSSATSSVGRQVVPEQARDLEREAQL
jgi:hypothetical protein